MRRLTSVTNARDKATESYAYDSGDRLTSKTDAAGRAEAMTYDSLKRLASRTDRNAQLHRYSYDPESRLSRIQRPDGALNMTCDAAVSEMKNLQ